MNKIVVIADFVYPNFLGGSARYVYDMIKGFEYNNIDFLLITRKKHGFYALENEKDEFYEKIKKENKIIEISGIIDIFKSFKYINKDNILNIHHPILGIFYSLFKTNISNTYFFHGPFHEEYKATSNKKIGYYIRYVLQKLVLKKATKVLVISDFMKFKVLDISNNSKIYNVGPIFDSEKFQCNIPKNKLRSKYSISLNKKVLFTSRRLTNRTGVLELVDNFIKDFNYDEYHLIIVGQGELQNKLEEKIKNVNNINYFKFVSEEKLVELMTLSSVYVLPTKELEGFGLVILEALSLNLPVVVSDKAGGGTDFIKHHNQNLIFEIENFSVSLKEKINYVFNKKILIDVNKFDYKIVSRNIYEQCLQN
ncbi:glycosyltransferase family 4 protein [Aliarcobacter cryaerophilus]|uniref:glycosyltransferase family 4 protein n=1 Tax=Aliarcobacter cryaerophilus TaxID=28198 RepID=UPI00164A2267|nr:glycosyltransferase family 4 protein [Aliarcobacter cryaerophilus]QNK84305.1 glycosyltransferase family 4 protein [Aliarcobacter cryaerophilus]